MKYTVEEEREGGNKFLRRKTNLANILSTGTDRDKIVDSANWFEDSIEQQILIHKFSEINKEYQKENKTLSKKNASMKLNELERLEIIKQEIIDDLKLLFLCRNKFVHKPITESVRDLIMHNEITQKEFKTIKKPISSIKTEEEFMDAYTRVCEYINHELEKRELIWQEQIMRKLLKSAPQHIQEKFKGKKPIKLLARVNFRKVKGLTLNFIDK